MAIFHIWKVFPMYCTGPVHWGTCLNSRGHSTTNLGSYPVKVVNFINNIFMLWSQYLMGGSHRKRKRLQMPSQFQAWTQTPYRKPTVWSHLIQNCLSFQRIMKGLFLTWMREKWLAKVEENHKKWLSRNLLNSGQGKLQDLTRKKGLYSPCRLNNTTGRKLEIG